MFTDDQEKAKLEAFKMLAAPGMGMLIQKEEKIDKFNGENLYNIHQMEQLAQTDDENQFLSPRLTLIHSSTPPDSPN